MTTLSSGEISATNVLPAFEASLVMGLSEEQLEEELGWTRAGLLSEGARVSAESTYRHFELLHGQANYCDFVLAAVALHTPRSLGVIGLACKTSNNVGEALQRHGRFQALTNRTVSYSLSQTADTLTLKEDRPGPSRLGKCLVGEYAQLVAVQLLGGMIANAVPVIACHTTRAELPPQTRSAFEKFLGAPLTTGSPHASVTLSASLLSEPVLGADSELATYFQQVLDNALPHIPTEAALVQQVRTAIRDGLLTSSLSLPRIAEHLGRSSRSLQRMLAAENTSFAQLLESTRRTLASGYLANRSLTISEVGYLLGYSEQASFFRAFKTWFGNTPSEFRALPLTQ